MKKFRVVLIIVAMVVIIADLTLIDYRSLTWSRNLAAYTGILAMILVILSMAKQIKSDHKQQEKLNEEGK